MNISQSENLSTHKTLSLIALAALAAFLLTVMPVITIFNYPFRLLITIVHELGHGLTALLTGGEFLHFVVFSDGSGVATSAGGWRVFIVPAGYLGAALFGASLILLGRSLRWSRIALAVIGGLMMLLSLRYGAPGIFSGHIFSAILTTVSGLLFGIMFLWIAFRASASWIIFFLHLIAIEAALMAFSDLMTVITLSTPFAGGTNTDAASMAELTFIPAIIWAMLWAVMAIGLVGGAIWFTWIKPLVDDGKG